MRLQALDYTLELITIIHRQTDSDRRRAGMPGRAVNHRAGLLASRSTSRLNLLRNLVVLGRFLPLK